MRQQRNGQINQRIKKRVGDLSGFGQLLVLLYVWRVLASIWLRSMIGRHRRHVHWVGRKRPPRRERLFLVTILFGAMFAMETHQYLLWSIFWGWMISIFVIAKSILLVIPRKRAHWIKPS